MPNPTFATRRISVRWISALVMGFLLAAAWYLVATVRPFDFDTGSFQERPQWLLWAFLVTCLLAWWAGQGVVRASWPGAIVRGAALGVIWWPVIVGVLYVAATVDAVVRGSADPFRGAGVAVVWALYAMVVIGLFCAVVAVPIGVIWAIASRVLTRLLNAPDSRARRVSVRVVGVLVAIGTVAGVGQALAIQPPEARCLDLGGYPTDAAFSPDGRLMAVTTLTDPNEPGEVVLLEWPSGREVGRWSGWVDQSVTVADDGRVYWPAWILGFAAGDATGDGIYTVRGSEEPHLIASGEEPIMNDLAWTVDGLRGTTSNSHQLAVLPFGPDTIEVLPDQPAQEVGAFWASPDGRTTVWSEGWFATSVNVATPAGRQRVPVGGDDQRSLAMTPDGRTLIAASWGSGTRMVDVSTGRAQLILQGGQQFIALSSTGHLAWAADDQIGHGRLCTALLSGLID